MACTLKAPVSINKGFNPLKATGAKPVAKAAKMVTSCSAKKAASLAAAAVVAAVPMVDAAPAFADVAGLTPCKDSKAFAKREKAELKGLNRRLKQYEEGSAPYLAIKATMDRTTQRFKNYGDYGLLCGADGLPHLIVSGDLNHLGEFTIPGLGFLYVAGWIGNAGRTYLNWNKATNSKPNDKEIIIDVPVALGIMFRNAAWPLQAFNELKNGDLLEKKENITVSPR